MYSGLELTRFSGRLMGAHQQVDHIARRHLKELLSAPVTFPRIRQILHFEGINGPDGIKLKSPSKNVPWHFFDPLHGDSTDFMKLLSVHYDGLIAELKAKNNERSAFEAAWLAHAIVDGLTPAHHYPFDEKLAELRSGSPVAGLTTYKKIFFQGITRRQTLKNMLKAYGPRGLYLGHWVFEWGFGGIMRPLRFPDARPLPSDIRRLQKLGYKEYFLREARAIARLDIYNQYLKKGWTPKLVRLARQDLAPRMIRTVTVLWYGAALEAQK
jgi:hypothetical protein